jgi:hypothetical protein
VPPTVDRQIQKMNDLSRLGAAVGSPVELVPPSHSEAVGPIALLVLALALLGVAGWMKTNPSAAPYVLYPAAAGLLFLLISAALLSRRRLEGGTLTLYERGFALARGGGGTAFAFDEVESLAVLEKERLSNGTPIGIFRSATVRGPAGKIRFAQLTRNGTADFVGAFLGKLLERLAEAAEARLRAGSPLTGGAWSLAQDGFRVRAAGTPVPAQTLARIGVFDNKVSLWRDGEDRPFFSIARDAPNVQILYRMMRHRLRDRPQPAATAGELGRILFERGSRPQAGLVGLLALAAGVICFWFAAAADPGDQRNLWTWSGALGVGILGFAAAVLWAQVARRHENGLSLNTLAGRRELLYTDIERMKYSVTRHYHNGAYTGTRSYLQAWSAVGKPITFSASGKGTETDLDALREDLAGRIAAKLRARLAHEPDVPWTPGVRLSHQGIRFAPKRFFGRGAEVTIPYGMKPKYSIQSGIFNLSAAGVPGKLTTACSAENFYPGLALLQILATEAAKTA